MTTQITQPLKWPGGKRYLREHIHRIARRTQYTHRVILCAGGLGEWWTWESDNISEVVNDVNLDLTNFYQVLQDPKKFEHMRRMLQAIPVSEWEFRDAELMGNGLTDGIWVTPEAIPDVQCAVSFFVRVRQSMMGLQKTFSPLTKLRTRSRMNAEVSAWMGAIEGLYECHERLSRAVVMSKRCIEVFKQQDSPATLFYYDPPYLLGERATQKLYQHEMSYEDHREMLGALCGAQGNVIISHYAHELYCDTLGHWNREVIDIDNKMSTSDTKEIKQEVLFYNF